ncbi:DUF4157 domain-containing protein [Actinoplanes sp. CA-030573]|uniref:eCIS core domain-containing protein n=1 Tax=Actinoplanes sp. CA-030573 TaxID=3239898 RepID=UPI003D8AD6AA
MVDERQAPTAGQMRKAEFLQQLYGAVVRAVDAEFAPYGRTAADCPTILRTLRYYRARPASSVLRLIQRFTHAPASADAVALIAATARQAGVVARGVARATLARSGPRVQSLGPQPAIPHDPGTVRAQLSTGEPLADETRAAMESSFGADFSSVRVHDDDRARRLTRALGARAFTVGSDIAFAAGEYRPSSAEGRRVLAHELAHTIQQSHGPVGPEADRQALEREADRAATTTGARDVRHQGAGARVQLLPVVVAAGLTLAEATPEIILASELGAEVVVADGVIVTAAETTPLLLEASAPALVESTVPAVLESTVPTVLETTAPAATSSFATTAVAATAAVTLSGDTTPTPTTSEESEEKKRKCRPDPCEHPLPISWPAELPYPEPMRGGLLVRTPSDQLEAEGISRAEQQTRLARAIREARDRGVPPPRPCDPDDAEPNAPYDAHHRHPLYLGGEEAEWNLCALRADRHQTGHPRLDNQSEHLAEYMECGICEASLRRHPPGQTYVIVASK